MRRIALALAAAGLLSPSGAASAAEVQVDEFIARVGPAQVTESNAVLKGGVIYRMEVSGTMTITKYGVTSNDDVVYCYSTSSGQCNPPSEAMALTVGFATGRTYPGIGGLQSFAEFHYDDYVVPPYDDGHVYSVPFRPVSDGELKLYVVTYPVKDDKPGLSGSFTIRLFREAPKQQPSTPDPQPGAAVQFGVPAGFAAPKPGNGVQLNSPTLPASLKRLTAQVALVNTAPTWTFGLARLRITDTKKLAAVCAFWGSLKLPVAQLQLSRQYSTAAAQSAGIFNTCAGALIKRIDTGAPITSDCRVTLVPVTLARTRLTARQRRTAIRFVRQTLASSCSSTDAGGLTVALQGRTEQATMAALLGTQMGLGIVRSRTTRADGASPTLAVRWSR